MEGVVLTKRGYTFRAEGVYTACGGGGAHKEEVYFSCEGSIHCVWRGCTLRTKGVLYTACGGGGTHEEGYTLRAEGVYIACGGGGTHEEGVYIACGGGGTHEEGVYIACGGGGTHEEGVYIACGGGATHEEGVYIAYGGCGTNKEGAGVGFSRRGATFLYALCVEGVRCIRTKMGIHCVWRGWYSREEVVLARRGGIYTLRVEGVYILGIIIIIIIVRKRMRYT